MVFERGRWFIYQIYCVEFVEDQVPEGQFQWLIEIVRYIQFMTGERVLTVEYQNYELYTAKFHKKKEQSIIILAFNTDVTPILGGLGYGK